LLERFIPRLKPGVISVIEYMKQIRTVAVILLPLVPLPAAACVESGGFTEQQVKVSVIDILATIVPIVSLVALIIMLYGAGSYLYTTLFRNQKKSPHGYLFWWGLGLLMIMASVGGVLQLFETC
jgi:ABC-type sulfate transport system permease subunit